MTEIFIGGRWRSALSGDQREIRCPADGSLVAMVAEAGAEDTRAAIGAARDAFNEGRWPREPAAVRGRLLHAVARLLERDRAAVARAESLDTGKRLVESGFDVDDVVAVFDHYAHAATEDAGRVVETGRPGVVSRVVHEPVGVCELITPWNYPLLQTAWPGEREQARVLEEVAVERDGTVVEEPPHHVASI